MLKKCLMLEINPTGVTTFFSPEFLLKRMKPAVPARQLYADTSIVPVYVLLGIGVQIHIFPYEYTLQRLSPAKLRIQMHRAGACTEIFVTGLQDLVRAVGMMMISSHPQTKRHHLAGRWVCGKSVRNHQTECC